MQGDRVRGGQQVHQSRVRPRPIPGGDLLRHDLRRRSQLRLLWRAVQGGG